VFIHFPQNGSPYTKLVHDMKCFSLNLLKIYSFYFKHFWMLWLFNKIKGKTIGLCRIWITENISENTEIYKGKIRNKNNILNEQLLPLLSHFRSKCSDKKMKIIRTINDNKQILHSNKISHENLPEDEINSKWSQKTQYKFKFLNTRNHITILK
jgi:hypothetical protein